MNNQNQTEVIIVDVDRDDYDTEINSGLREDEALKPGRHTFRRGGFLERHNIHPTISGVIPTRKLLLDLDDDIFIYFQNRIEDNQNLSAQLNFVLRKVMELEQRVTE